MTYLIITLFVVFLVLWAVSRDLSYTLVLMWNICTILGIMLVLGILIGGGR